MLAKNLLRAIAGVLVLLSVWPSRAEEVVDEPLHPIFDRTWIAASTTAMGITGDVVLTPTTITFDGRVTFHWRYLSQVMLAKPHPEWGTMPDFSLYEILDPRPEYIRKGSGLCGSTYFGDDPSAARYIAVGIEQDRDDDRMLLLVFESPGPPDIEKDEMCGGLGYFAYPVLRYEPAVVRLAGFLVVQEYVGSPDYWAASNRIKPELILILDRPVALQGDPGDERDLPAFGDLYRIPLVISDPDIWARLGHQVILEGTLSAEDPVTVVMTVKRLVPSR